MINRDSYLAWLTERLTEKFSSRLIYIGLQGSYLRGEADENSDFDVMLVLDSLTPADLDAYREILLSGGHYDKSCGFVCGRDDLACWNPLEIRHILHTTRDVYGCLAELLPPATDEDQRNFILLSVNNLYHELCHRYIHRSREKNIAALPGTYRAAFFILQNLHHLRTGVFVQTKAELLDVLDGDDREVMRLCMELKNAETYDFDAAYELLFRWCRGLICSINNI
ncbi:MAG: nucleotidyltransferase domain-containing protein [Clostridia bacterium]|nr:nucleotidyltransferase domain-containing protein [Clostridia bacterium]